MITKKREAENNPKNPLCQLLSEIPPLEMAIKIARALGYPYEAFVEMFSNDMLRKSGIKKIVHLESKAA